MKMRQLQYGSPVKVESLGMSSVNYCVFDIIANLYQEKGHNRFNQRSLSYDGDVGDSMHTVQS